MSTFKVIAVTNRHLCDRALVEQIERIIRLDKPDRIILREKDLSEEEYQILAEEVLNLCKKNQIDCILHTYIQVAIGLSCKEIHMSFSDYKENYECLQNFHEVGVSIHSVEEAIWAKKKGASYVTAGHIFATDCKMGVLPRGIDFLNAVCKNISIPVYAIGGINKENISLLKETGASGACIMSGFMKR